MEAKDVLLVCFFSNCQIYGVTDTVQEVLERGFWVRGKETQGKC